MTTVNTGFQRATKLTVRQGNEARIYSLLDSFVGDAPYWYATQEQGTGVWLVGDDMRSEGWGVLTDASVTTMVTYLGGGSVGGGKLKAMGLEYWAPPNAGATNEVGFNLRGNGYRATINLWDGKTTYSTAWSLQGKLLNTTNTTTSVRLLLDFDTRSGCGIRLVRPATTAEQLLPDGELSGVYYYGNDGKIYRVTKIGTQVWLADNLAETKWSDGTWIQGFDGGEYTPISDANWASLTNAALCAYDDDLTNVLSEGASSIIYPALTATELALLSTSEFNARVTAFLQYVSEQEGMTIGDVITNSERVENATVCPIPTPGEMYSVQVTTTGVGVPGEITKDPDALLYTSGTVVTITAADNAPVGYFVRWEVYELGTWTTHTTNYSFDVTVIQNYSFRAVYSDMAQ